MTIFRLLLTVALALTVMLAHGQGLTPVPALQSRVTDMAGMLTENQRNNLENVLKEYEERTGSQIAILLVRKTEPEAIEQYSIRVADKWKLGRKGVDDGVILVVAKDNPPALRRLRIEAGRGVQGSLTDAQSKRILQDVIAPHFRQNDFYGGLAAGVSAITSFLDKEKLPAAERNDVVNQGGGIAFDTTLILFLVVMALFVMLSRRGSSRRYYRHDRDAWGRNAGVILGGGLGGGFGGGFGGGGFGGGRMGGGGFSGGGGGFDGGGASGDW
ncbi:MAG: uncharacterized protein V7631_1788 [Massilia sp.]|jgi:uncharacterized protein